MEDIHIRQVKLETILIDKRDDIDSLIKSKVEMSEQINTIDKNIDLMRKIIEKSSSTMTKMLRRKMAENTIRVLLVIFVNPLFHVIVI